MNRETTLVGNNIINSIRKAKELGYIIRLRYVGVSSPEIAKERIAKRIAMGGHGVSEETIDRRFGSSLENFYKVYNLCDNINIFDNSGSSMVLVAYSKSGILKRTDVSCEWCDNLIQNLNETKTIK